MLKATAYIVASTGTYHGTAFARSPKKAVAEAQSRAYEALQEGDAKARYCSGIAVEGFSIVDTSSNRVIASFCDL